MVKITLPFSYGTNNFTTGAFAIWSYVSVDNEDDDKAEGCWWMLFEVFTQRVFAVNNKQARASNQI